MSPPYTPSPIVEVAFGFGPYDEPTGSEWVDITEDVYEVSIQRGRSSEFESFPASTATISLYNDSRVYDPLNLAGPYVETVPNGKTPFIAKLNTKTGTSLGASNAMNMPTGIIAGELLLAFVTENAGGTALTASVGWTQVRQNQHVAGGVNMRTALFAKIAAGSDTLSLSGATEDFACVVMRLPQHGVTTIGTDILSASQTAAGGEAFVQPNSVSIALGKRERPYLALVFIGTDTSMTITSPSDMIEEAAIVSAATTCATAYVASEDVASPTGSFYSTGRFLASVSVAHANAYAVLIPGATGPKTQLQPNVPIRIMADLAADGTFPVWRGVVDGWPGTYSEGGFRNEVEVSCTDVFKTFAERKLPDTLLLDLEDALLISGQPTSWFRGDLSPDGQLVDYQGYSKNGQLVTSVSIGDGISRVSPKSLEFPAGQSGVTNRGVEIPVPRGAKFTTDINDDLLAGATWAWSALVRADGGAAASASATLMGTLAGNNVFYISGVVADTGIITAMANGSGATLTATPTPGIASSDKSINLFDGKTHHVVILRIRTALAIWIDGQFVTSTSNGLATTFFNQTGASIVLGRSTGSTPGISMGEIMFWPQTGITTVEIPALFQALTVGFGTPRQSGEVVNDVLDLIDWPASLRAIDEGELIIQPPGNPGGRNALDVLQKIADSEQGRLFIDAEGKVVFHDRARTLVEASESTVQYTFSDLGSDVGTRDESLQVTLDDRFLYDGASVTREDGVEQSAANSSKPLRTRSLDGLFLTDDHQALAIAEWIVYRYGRPEVRTEAWEIDPETKPADWADILGLEIGHRVMHDVTPGGIGSSLELEQHIELIEHEITPEEWVITMNGSPVDSSDYFLWDSVESTDLVHGWNTGVWG